jgi:hypothetical protein
MASAFIAALCPSESAPAAELFGSLPVIIFMAKIPPPIRKRLMPIVQAPILMLCFIENYLDRPRTFPIPKVLFGDALFSSL